SSSPSAPSLSLRSPSLLPTSRVAAHRPLPSFPTRRSSDLTSPSCSDRPGDPGDHPHRQDRGLAPARPAGRGRRPATAPAIHLHRDRKSTRLNSSHVKISYAVFCLKKKKRHKTRHKPHTRRT